MKKADLLNKSFRMSRSLQDNFDFWSYERGSPAFRGRGGETKKGQKKDQKGRWHLASLLLAVPFDEIARRKSFFFWDTLMEFFSEIRWVV